MNKTVKTIFIALAVIAIVVSILVAIFKVNGKAKTGLEPVNSSEDLSALVDKIYEGEKGLFPSLQTQTVDVADSDFIKYYTGLENGTNLEYIVASEPMISSQAYSLVVAKVKAGIDANAIAKEMSEKVNTAKWICVSADKLYATSSGDIVFLVMSSEDMAKPIYEKFKTLAGNVNAVYEKSEEASFLPVMY